MYKRWQRDQQNETEQIFENSAKSPARQPPSHEPLGATTSSSDNIGAAVGVDPTGVAAVAQQQQ